MKDQRLEMRVTQQTLDNMDEIIASINTPFKLSRSDLGRAYIEQGIERHYGGGPKEESFFSLADRLNIFFQLCQLQHSRSGTPDALPRDFDRMHLLIQNYTKSTVTVEALVRQVYLQRYMWFFELDEMHLQSINCYLNRDYVLSLMEPQHNQEVCNALDTVIVMRNMFTRIDEVMKSAEQEARTSDDSDANVYDTLTRIKGYVTDNDIPLSFQGYPNTAAYTQRSQMWALLDWIDNGRGDQRISDSFLRQDNDLTDKYAVLLEVYQNICSNKRFDLNGLEQMVKSRQLYML